MQPVFARITKFHGTGVLLRLNSEEFCLRFDIGALYFCVQWATNYNFIIKLIRSKLHNEHWCSQSSREDIITWSYQQYDVEATFENRRRFPDRRVANAVYQRTNFGLLQMYRPIAGTVDVSVSSHFRLLLKWLVLCTANTDSMQMPHLNPLSAVQKYFPTRKMSLVMPMHRWTK